MVGHVTNTAFATGTTPDGETIDCPDTQETLQIGTPHLSLRKEAISEGPFQVGSPVPYAYRVTNTGSFPLTDVHVSDDRVATVTCDTTTLSPGDSATCRGTYTITRADIINCLKSMKPEGRGDDGENAVVCDVTNVSQAEGTALDGTPITSDPARATVSVELKKQKEKCPKPPKCEKDKHCPKPPKCGQKPGHDDGGHGKPPAKSEAIRKN